MKKSPVVITLTLGQIPFVIFGTLALMTLFFAGLGFKVFMWGV